MVQLVYYFMNMTLCRSALANDVITALSRLEHYIRWLKFTNKIANQLKQFMFWSRSCLEIYRNTSYITITQTFWLLLGQVLAQGYKLSDKTDTRLAAILLIHHQFKETLPGKTVFNPTQDFVCSRSLWYVKLWYTGN